MPDATGTPDRAAYPDWLLAWEHTAATHTAPVFKKRDTFDTDQEYEMVELVDFTFLGRRFLSTHYVEYPDGPDAERGDKHTVAGVSRELAAELKAAQRRIFDAFVARSREQGSAIDGASFREWCGVTTVSGYQFRGGRHGYGAAIDLDVPDNPYVATGLVGDPGSCAGEGYSNANYTEDQRRRVNLDALAVYERALQLVYDVSLEGRMTADRRSEPTATIWRDIAQVSSAVATYFSLAYPRQRTNRLAGDETGHPYAYEEETPFCFRETFGRYRDYGVLRGAHRWEGRDQALYHQIRADHPRIRLVMVYDELTPHAHGIGGSGWTATSGTRDPTRGFLTLRKEVVAGLRAPGSHIVWGACDWGAGRSGSGDLMHFDIRNRGAVTADPHAKAGTVYYGKR